jgi:hypothetical protein
LSAAVTAGPPEPDPDTTFAGWSPAEIAGAVCEVCAALVARLDAALADGGPDWVTAVVDAAVALSGSPADPDHRRALGALARDLRRGGGATAERLETDDAAEVSALAVELAPALVLVAASVGDTGPAELVAEFLGDSPARER